MLELLTPPSNSPVPAADSLRRKATDEFSDAIPSADKRQRTTASDDEVYDRTVAFFITYEDHGFDDSEFDREMNNVRSFFRHNLSVDRSVNMRIPKTSPQQGALKYVQEMIDQKRDQHEQGSRKRLHLVYYRGHGMCDGERTTLHATSRPAGGQSFNWNAVQWNRADSRWSDTVLLLDCSHAGAAIRPSLEGCKEVFAACSAESSAYPPGNHSFSSLLMRAGWAFDGPFTLSDWVDKTTLLAFDCSYELPIHKTCGDDHPEVRFRKYRAPGARRARAAAMFNAIDTLVANEVLRANEGPNGNDLIGMEEDEELIEPFTAVDVYKALRRVRDEQALENLSMEDRESVVTADLGSLASLLRKAGQRFNE